jgi:tetratricopeptide (TPR) repeat protein
MNPRVLACLLGAALAVAGVGFRSATQSPAAQTIEAAYRANNVGVAHLEQYDFAAATAAFKRALEQDGKLAIARLNLGIALFYGGQAELARKELESARPALPDRPHPDYVLGLIARASDQPDAAFEAFTRAQRLDATDPGIAINIGQLHLQQRRYADAIAAFRSAITFEPYNATAAYGLATALIRSGDAEAGKTAMERFEQLRTGAYATTFSQTYLEQGRYAEAIASTGAEAGLVSDRTPDVGFADGTKEFNAETMAAPGGAAVALFDLDRDGDLELAVAGPQGLRLYRNEGRRFSDISAAAFATPPAAVSGIVGGDCDNDGDTDLLVVGASGTPALFRQETGGRFVADREAGLPPLTGVRSAAWLDSDHDGDLDLAIAGVDASKTPTVVLLRNNGEGRFTDVSAAASLNTPRSIVAIVPTDFDDRRDVDLFMLPASGLPALFRNLRDGTFSDVARERGLTAEGEFTCAAIGDFNKDNYPDFFLGQRGGAGHFATSDGRGRFGLNGAPAATAGALACQFLDYDNDGLLDLLAVTDRGPRLVRNAGAAWTDVTHQAFKSAGPSSATQSTVALASGDLDGDGDTDIVIGNASGLAIWRNDGGSASRSLRVRLTARVSNRTALGAKIDMRAGSLKQRLETSSTTPAAAPADLTFGLGQRAGADVARVLWPSGILQAETAAPGAAGGVLTGALSPLNIEELDRKPSSCPYLYTWTGERFEFLTDFLGGGEMGYWQGPGLRNTPDPDEYVRIPGDRLRERNGRYDLRITNELEEALFLDRVRLVAVAHPRSVDVFPNEGLRSTSDPFKLFNIADRRTPDGVVDEHGHDVLERVSRIDRRYPDDFALAKIRGYAEEHSLTIDLPPPMNGRRALVLTGWTDYAFSGDNVAAHQLGLRMVPPSLQLQDERGVWKTAIAEIGFPVGRPQTVVVDLSDRVPAAARKVRISTTMRVYWDAIEVGTIVSDVQVTSTTLEPLEAGLRWRGFSALDSPDKREPFGGDYYRVTAFSPWKLMPGRYTREGDVRDLVLQTDDMFIVTRPGDEIAVSFDARLPGLPEGWTRTFLMYADGFSKEMDLNSSSPDELDPLPFHAMKEYPYARSAAPARTARYQEYLDRYNTRVVKRTLPPLELSAPISHEP